MVIIILLLLNRFFNFVDVKLFFEKYVIVCFLMVNEKDMRQKMVIFVLLWLGGWFILNN